MGDFLGVGVGLKYCLGSTHVVEQFLFSIVSSILTFNFDLILGSFITFRGPNWLFLGLGVGFKNFCQQEGTIF